MSKHFLRTIFHATKEKDKDTTNNALYFLGTAFFDKRIMRKALSARLTKKDEFRFSAAIFPQ